MAYPPEASPSEVASEPHSTRMLLIDDDSDFAELAVKFLKEGCIESIDAVNSGKDALARLDTNEYDVIMCDYRMPEMDGIELLKEVRSRGIRAPFVMMTGKGMDDAVIEALDAGADFHVEKSGDMRVQFAELSVVIRNLAGRRRAERQLKGERDLYKLIVDMNMVGILVLEADGKVAIWNDGIAKLTGIGSEDATGRPFSLESTPLLSDIVERGKVEGVLKGRISPNNLMPYLDGESGKTRYFEVGYYPVPDEKGRTSASMIFVLDSTERIIMKMALEVSEKNHRQLVELVDEGIWSVDKDDKISFINPKMAQMMACSAKEMIGRSFSEFVTDDGRKLASEALELCRSGNDVEIDYEFKNRIGKRQFVSFKASPIVGDGEYQGAVCIFVDLASRRSIEEALSEALSSREAFEKIVNASPVVVFQINPSPPWNVEFVSDNVTQFGYTPDEFSSGRITFAEVIHPDGVEDVMEGIEKHIRAGDDLFSMEYQGLTKSGETLFIDAHVYVRRDPEGNVTKLQGVILDNTERRRTALEIERLASMVDSSTDAIISKSTDGTIQTWNPAAESMYGYSLDEAVGRPISMLIPPDRLDEYYREFGRAKGGIRGQPFETVWMRKDGSMVDVSLTISPVKDRSGRTIGAFAIARNITERKEAEEALEQANEKLSLMGSITRHDAINQIGILSGYLSLAEDDSNDRERAEHMEAAKRACRTITEQLQFAGSYQKAGTKDPEWTRVRLEFAGAASVTDMEGMQVKEKLGDLEVLVDPMFERVFLNLLTNTRRHGQNATQVVVEFEPRDDAVAIRYSDDGIGIPADKKEKIFQRGYGTDSGLGLFLVREVLGITGMSIREIGVPDEGAVFEILVPNGKHRMPSESG
ncbi:MAG: PAS domain S-box protein [Candidatus Thermoplasmatota archaeon]|nr:PAS domain S-box protein [Candidatus Thermoplasmatota archaeon]